MGRKRKNHEDNKLPPRVYSNKYSYYYKPTSKECITIGPVSMPLSQLWARYEALIDEQANVMTFSKLWGLFLKSAYYLELKPRTQKDYLQHQKKLLAVFGKITADKIKTEDIRMFMDRRGLQSKTQANHEMSSMSRVFRWGFERGMVKGNPCQGVSKFKAVARGRYITDAEYEAIYKEADDVVRTAMEIAYLCAARLADVLGMQWRQVTPEGIFIQQGKNNVSQIKQWTDRLKQAFKLAKTFSNSGNPGAFVLMGSHGSGFSKRGFSHRWEEARHKASVKLGYVLDCTFHDLKAKGISDYEGSSRDKQLFSGHKTESQVLIYDRKTKVSPTLDKPPIETKNSK
ncbi:tyrosine-type recombinase/integrase [Klebsiella pneumoniae]|uniref:tyrosine-type recombinase/integrase n=1 Tax=Klebsiella pneumoniae TaxID=573 RepID=UPI0025C7BADA|nr:tyrosine-type recombinase/integrase [Klebsiella pneumoniae]EKZ6077499.1 tyrosine-type recombinase/integrase [Klebsiella pneumoniae]ELY5758364.1 tyrosine-type recombinase/integrase [Klebsiella pneumoniae]HDU2441464.1 tyrosine-type recombinase/integrase [Klebsiella pneumoniae]